MIQSYGLNWKFEDGMTGTREPGVQIDFSRQLGVYLLYFRQKIAYVGRSSFISEDEAKGKTSGIYGRLINHKIEKRWEFDSYSWFGLLRHDKAGNLIRDPQLIPQISVSITDLEALLIFVLNKPEWNSTWGDYKRLEKNHLFKQVVGIRK